MLDVGWLLLLKLLKEPGFKFDRPFIDLYIKNQRANKEYPDAITFIKKHRNHFGNDEYGYLKTEAELYYKNLDYRMAINSYYELLRPNSNPENFREELYDDYISVIRLVINDFGVEFDFRREYIDSLVIEDPKAIMGVDTNFKFIEPKESTLNVIKTLFLSIRKIRKVKSHSPSTLIKM